MIPTIFKACLVRHLPPKRGAGGLEWCSSPCQWRPWAAGMSPQSCWGISGQIDKNKSYKRYKVRQPKNNSAQWECARSCESLKTCAHALFLIKGGISEQIDKNKSYKGYKVRQQFFVSPIRSCIRGLLHISRQSDKNNKLPGYNFIHPNRFKQVKMTISFHRQSWNYVKDLQLNQLKKKLADHSSWLAKCISWSQIDMYNIKYWWS
jgi:hypothetical protein